MAQERSVDALLQLIVDRLVERSHIALARIWLKRPGDICGECPLASECPTGTDCLHLVASAGFSQVDPLVEWSDTHGEFRRIPQGVRTVGRIFTLGKAIEMPDTSRAPDWNADFEAAEGEGIRGFSGRPLVFMGEVLGVLAVYTRIPFAAGSLMWVGLLADQASAAISNANAFGEIERLKDQLKMENEYLREEVLEVQAFGDIVGKSSALQAVLRQIDLVAPTDATVLVLGESGTGKELVAREIHKRSERRDKPMVRVNCASVPRELYESEFFGHAKGAFTGAVKDRAGRFELADGGTLFLDEVGEIPLELQSKLLRVLQEGQYERLGEERTRQVDVRIVAATNHDLRKEVEEGRFREDLYYRLNVFPIEVVPLRKRQDDIPLLAAHFVKTLAKQLGRPEPRLTQAHAQILGRHEWAGNVRELQNVIERALITSPPGTLRFELTPISGSTAASATPAVEAGEVLPEMEMKRRERLNLLAALQRADWKISGPGGAAELLGVKPTTMASRIKKFGLERPA